jgi:hypothetical protein
MTSLPTTATGTADRQDDDDVGRPAECLRTKPAAEYDTAKGYLQGDDAHTGWSRMLMPRSCSHDPDQSPTRGFKEEAQDDMDAGDTRGEEGLKSRQRRRGGEEENTSPVPGSA